MITWIGSQGGSTARRDARRGIMGTLPWGSMRGTLRAAVAVLLASGGLVAAAPAAQADDAADFLPEARLFYRVVACGSSDPLPATLDAATVDAHCAEMARRYQHYTDKYVA